MTNEFTDYCNTYYQLKQLYEKRETRLNNMLNAAPLYNGETKLSDIDAIISYYRDVQAYKKKADKTFNDIKAIERIILMIMRHFEIPTGTILTGELPEELEYEIWCDENEAIYISKTKSLAKSDNPNIITFTFWRDGKEEEEED